MTETRPQSRLVRFGAFEVDLRTGELRKAGVKLKFSGQPFQVLVILLEHPGDVVTREELQRRLWPDTFVDVDANLNTAINKIREMLGDSAESPHYVETLPRRGYRFIAPIEGNSSAAEHSIKQAAAPDSKSRGKPMHYGMVLLGVVIVVVSGIILWRAAIRTPGAPKAVQFRKLTNDGRRKVGPLVSDGVRVYFNEWLSDGPSIIAQVPIKGGEVVPISVPLKEPFLLDLSKDGTELLVGNHEGPEGNSIWVQPVAGGSPQRIGTILTQYAEFASEGIIPDAGFGASGTSVLFNQVNTVYTVNRDGYSSRKLFPVENVAYHLRFSPDGRVIRFSEYNPLTNETTMMGASADGTEPFQMFQGCCGDWTPDGRFFIFLRRNDDRHNLWALSEPKHFLLQERDEKPTQLTAGPLDLRYPLPGKDGREILAVGVSPQLEVIRYDSRIREFVPYLSGMSAEALAFSSDGRWVAYTFLSRWQFVAKQGGRKRAASDYLSAYEGLGGSRWRYPKPSS